MPGASHRARHAPYALLKCRNAAPVFNRSAGPAQGTQHARYPRATRRPDHVKPPAHWSKSPPVPVPQPIAEGDAEEAAKGPTRFGDWEHKGIAIDF